MVQAIEERGETAVTHAIEQAIFDVSRSLEVPVLILALLALAAVIVEIGGFAVELRTRQPRHFPPLAAAARTAREAVDAGIDLLPQQRSQGVAWSAAMATTLETIAANAGEPGADTRLAKALADFDFDSQRRLARTRLLVRAGPALGLMGTLIPLSPALEGLAQGPPQPAQPEPPDRVQRDRARPAGRPCSRSACRYIATGCTARTSPTSSTSRRC